MDYKKPKLSWTLMALLAAVCLFGCLWLLFLRQSAPEPEVLPPVVVEPEPIPDETPDMPEPEPAVESPVDFEVLQAEHPDIYAWIQVPGTPIDYPIVQRFGDDSYYLRRDLDGNYSVAGSLFTEFQYNVDDFSDPMTVVYGHQMNDGTMFGSLQPYMTSHELGEGDLIYIYLPDCRKTYQIFAAVPYDTSHILYYHNFHTQEGFDRFIEKISTTRSLYANINEEFLPAFGDPLIVLSTCMVGNNQQRFLTVGVQVAEEAITKS